ncbi:precorrin-2 dehydrogenase/sirohydrochlorin ferrochelatase family protein [Sporolituus thermophilus]|uniref:precorrin-2 dehydrogenase/sirohydrochlorin ferrochelatase family protein n=1 Tax=Sporolituus thermophilus TaxID=608505 RepID=UPI001FDEA509|nr:bifunctional precorrin-2 dehydrogenase/sirohydrochlorin ferrochelatase [Sporolituus thermophilus]
MALPYYPVNLNLAGRRCAVIGGGAVAARKVLALLAAGAAVTVVSPAVTAELAALAAAGQITHIERPYWPGAIENFFIVICATDDPDVNRQAAEEGRAKGALVNVADAPELCDFTVPSQIVRGDLVITVSTGGKSPALARRLRQELEARYGPEYGLYLAMVGRLRDEMKERLATPRARECFWRRALDDEALALVKAGKLHEAEEKIRDAIGGIRAEP